jgi:cellulose synthase/poly-beta-1,6-N-acetylglucosamine synthase-like glycosyltransferase/peptidoglycan/xylan/chitin deacetylase (PgdA/CDA1 family)
VTRRSPKAHWSLLAAALLAVLTAVLLQSLSAGVGRAATAPAGRASALSGPVVYRSATGLASRPLPAKTVALTFDDGPDPRWTPAVLDVLARERVPATFFVVGSRVAAHAALVRRERRAGHELGNHTWDHVDLTAAAGWRRRLELNLTQLALEGSAGVSTALMRPPYSSEPNAVGAKERQAIEDVTGAGYVVVLSDRDSEDWRRPGPAAIVRNALPDGPEHGAGTIVLLHDGGGDRSQTVAALPALIASYRAQGYAFTTVSGALGLSATAGERSAPLVSRWQGRALLVTNRAASLLVHVVTWALLPLGLLSLLRSLLVVALARRHVRLSAARVAGAEWLPAVSVLVPAYNEAVGIERAVRALVASDYPQLEVVVIDDGSTDGTGDIVEGLGLPHVQLVRQPNGGKAAALAAGVRHASHDVLVMLDGDTVFEADTVRRLVQPLRDPRVGAVSGNTKVGNRRGLLGRWQHLEYVSGFNLDRRLLDLLGCITTVPGAAGAFRREAVVAAGGLSTDTLAEDTDITMAILRAGYRVVHEERARAWTEAPSTVTDLWRQRWRWGYGTLQCIWKHRSAVREPGSLGRVGLPYMLAFQVLLPLAAPLIDVFAVHGILVGEGERVAVVWLVYAAVSVAIAGYALHLDGESFGPLWSLPLQQLFYRQLIYLVVIQSVVSALAGLHLPWHKLERTGEVTVPA